MKSLFSLLLLGAALCGAAAEEVNLLKNADLAKKSGANPLFFQCVTAPGALKILPGDGDSRILSLTKTNDQPCMVIQRNLPLDGEKSYLASAEVRSSKEDSKCMIYVEWRTPLPDGKFRHQSVNARPIEPGEEWEEILFEIPPRPADAEKPYLVFAVHAGSAEFRHLKVVSAE